MNKAGDCKTGLCTGLAGYRIFAQVFWAWTVPLALFGVALLAYSRTLTRWYTYDSLSYAYQIRNYIESGNPGHLLHPHHLLFNPLGFCAWQTMNNLGFPFDTLRALQYMNAFLGSAGLVLLYTMLRKGGIHLQTVKSPVYRVHPFAALVCTLVIGTSYGYWDCAVDGRVNMSGFLVMILIIGLAWGMLDKPSAIQCAMTGFATVLGVGLHQSHGLLIVPVMGAMLLSPGRWQTRVSYLLLSMVVFFSGISTLYLGFGWMKGLSTFDEFNNWMLAYAHDGRWWSFDIERNVILNARAIMHTFITDLPSEGEGQVDRSIPNLLHSLRWGALCMVLIVISHALYVTAVSGVKRYMPNDHRLPWGKFEVLALTALPYSMFFTVWTPGYFVFWIPISIALVCWLSMFVSSMKPFMQGVFAGILIVWIVYASYANLNATILRRTDWNHNPLLRLCDQLNTHTSRGDLIILTGMGPLAKLEVYMPYFTGLAYKTMNMELNRLDPPHAVESVRATMSEQIREGHDIIIFGEFRNQKAWIGLKKQYGVSPDTADKILDGYRMSILFEMGEHKVYKLEPVNRLQH
ncbi:MAG: hypothetical protein ACYC27_06255 [Armatimonadota bacterium]